MVDPADVSAEHPAVVKLEKAGAHPMELAAFRRRLAQLATPGVGTLPGDELSPVEPLPRLLTDLSNTPAIRDALQWFNREKQSINEQHLQICRVAAPTFFEQARAESARPSLRLANLNPAYLPTPAGLTVFSADYKWLNLALVNAQGTAVAAECVARYTAAVLAGKTPLTMGQALAGALRAGLAAAGVPVWLNTPLADLQLDTSGRVTGVVVTKDGVATGITATRGVLVAAGGFEHNLAMRLAYQRQPIGVDWTVGAKENTGDGIQAGLRAGAATDFLDDSWWGPAIPLPDEPYFCLAERTLPGSLMVNSAGMRFVNEAAPYSDVVHVMYDKNGITPDIPAWLIFDQNYRNRYLFRDVAPALPFPDDWYSSGAVFKEYTLSALAGRIGVSSSALSATVSRFNGFACHTY